jgi:hypothetical protein
MTEHETKQATKPGRPPSEGSKRGGYLVAVIVNAVLLFLINAHPGWRSVSFLTPAMTQVITLVNACLWAGAIANFIYFLTDPKRLKALGDLVTLSISLAAGIRLLQVFPFAFHGSAAWCSTLVTVLLVIGIVGTCIGLLYSLAMLVRPPRRSSDTGR